MIAKKISRSIWRMHVENNTEFFFYKNRADNFIHSTMEVNNGKRIEKFNMKESRRSNVSVSTKPHQNLEKMLSSDHDNVDFHSH